MPMTGTDPSQPDTVSLCLCREARIFNTRRGREVLLACPACPILCTHESRAGVRVGPRPTNGRSWQYKLDRCNFPVPRLARVTCRHH